MITYKQLIDRSKKMLENSNLPTNAVYIFLQEKLNLKMHEILLKENEYVDDKFLEEFSEIFSDYLVDEKPIAYIFNKKRFYGLDFYVDSNVLIPRDETEELVEIIIKIFSNRKDLVFADIGVGSGNIAISLAKNLKYKKIYGVDISDKALKIANDNAKKHDVIIEFVNGNMLDYFIENNIKLDFIVSNPPYIDKSFILDKSVIDYEPHIALFAKEEGMFFYREILSKADVILNDGGYIFFEIGYDQKEKIINLINDILKNKYSYNVIKDLNNNDRIVLIKKENL